MKPFLFLIALFVTSLSLATGKNIIKETIEIQNVTVYLKGAQIAGSKDIKIPAGQSTLLFTGLPSDIDSKSIRVSAEGSLSIFSVNLSKDYLGEKDNIEKEFTDRKKLLENLIRKGATDIQILDKRLEFLSKNQNVSGNQTGVQLDKLKAADDYFNSEITKIYYDRQSIQQRNDSLGNQLNLIENQIHESRSSVKQTPGNIEVVVDAPAAGQFRFNVEFYTKNAGWFPVYDIKVNSVEKPLNLNYRANIYQSTGVDWKNVNLKLSSANPDLPDALPEMKVYYLDYGVQPPTYDKNKPSKVSGRVTSAEDNSPVIGATVMVKNSSIGTITDVNGFYEITIPAYAEYLVFSFIGMETQERFIDNANINVNLLSSQMNLEEVVVVGYGTNNERQLAGSVAGVQVKKSNEPIRIRGISSIPVQTEVSKRQSNVEFAIKKPFSVPSDSKNHALEIDAFEVPADYIYSTSPKIKPVVLLNAQVVNWEQLSLLDGEANLFFEGTFTGKNLLTLQSFSDTLNISLGNDRDIIVKREEDKKFSSSKFLGSKKETTRSWKITVRNNKSAKINIEMFDQIPITTNSEIEISDVELNGGKLDAETGKVTWNLNLSPGEQVEKILSYTVKHPKNKRLVIE
jgi:hypothetical protein